MSGKGLVRPKNSRWIGGVCAGMAQQLGWSPTVVRLLYVLISLISVAFPGILFYLLLWFVIPNE